MWFRSLQGLPLAYLVVHRDEGVVWGKGPGGSLAVNEKCLLPSVHQVFLHLSNVVGHVVDDLHVKVVRCGLECLGKRLRER